MEVNRGETIGETERTVKESGQQTVTRAIERALPARRRSRACPSDLELPREY